MQSKRDYEIRLYDRTLMTFSISDGLLDTEVRLIDYDNDAEALMPPGIGYTGEDIWNWLEARSIPANRKNASAICEKLGFRLGDTEALYRTSLGLSLNDSYWIVPMGFDGMFSDYNLFENGFSEAIGALAVSGYDRGAVLKGNTPELTTDGNLRKGWRLIGENRVLYKGSSIETIPGEPWSEYLAALIAQSLRLDAVAYRLDYWNDELCSTCVNFATKDISYVPFAVASGQTSLAGVLWYCQQLGSEYFERVCDMLAFDAIITNTDRHLTNFGLLRDNRTGRIAGLAPIFDNGRSLFFNQSVLDTEHCMVGSRYSAPAFGGRSFEELLSRIAGDRQHELMERAASVGIIGNTEVPGDRVRALDAYIRERSAELHETIPMVDHGYLVEQLFARDHIYREKKDNLNRLQPIDMRGDDTRPDYREDLAIARVLTPQEYSRLSQEAVDRYASGRHSPHDGPQR